jgi:hypothetical protein
MNLYSAEITFRKRLETENNKGRIFMCASSKEHAIKLITTFIKAQDDTFFLDFRFNDVRNHGVEPVLIYKPKQ